VDPVAADRTVDRLPDRSARDTGSARQVAPAPPRLAPPEPAVFEMRRSLSGGLGRVLWPLLELPRPLFRRVRPAQLVVAAAVTLAVVGGLGWLSQGAGEPIPADTAIVRVGAGETIWDVAQRVAPESDPPAVVARIRQLNRIEGSALQPGQQLWVPDGR
jgi:hypothetical protein